MSAVKFRRGFGLGAYEVLLDGEVIGEVRKWERRYNLRRVYVSRGWRAMTADGRRLYDSHGCTAATRADATTALLEEVAS